MIGPRHHLVVVGALAAALAGALVADRAERPSAVAAALAPAPSQPSASSPTGMTSTWFCPGGSTSGTAPAELTVQLANPTPTPILAQVTAFGADGATEPKARDVLVPARGAAAVRVAEVLGSGGGGAQVLGDHGGLVAQQLLRTPEGTVAGACASAVGTTWATAVGSTAAGSTLVLALLNPFPEDAILDATFATTEGRKIPAELQGLVVPARSVRLLDVGEAVRRQDAVSADLKVRQGRLAVARTFRKGTATSLALAAAAGTTAWYFPAGARTDGTTTRLSVFNPGEADADVEVEVRLADEAVEPLTLSVPGRGRGEVDLDDAKLAKGAVYALVVRSMDDVPIVVERSVEARTGRSDLLGLRGGSRRWGSPGAGSRGTDSFVVQNLGEADATVRVVVLDGKGGTPLPGEPTPVPTGGRAVIRLDDKTRGAAILLEADGDIGVERDAGDAAPTAGAVPAVPLPL